MDNIIKTTVLAVILAIGTITTTATEIPAGNKSGSHIGFNVTDINLEGTRLNITANIDFSHVKLQRNREIICTPMIVNGSDTIRLQSFAVAGRNRFYNEIRNGQQTALLFKGWGSDRGELSLQSSVLSLPMGTSVKTISKKLTVMDYSTPYRQWMETAIILLDVIDRGCANCKNSEELYGLAVTDFIPRVYEPTFVYVTPVAEAVKTREVSGRAFIDFKVNQTDILPDYRRNATELAKIIATIDSVKDDKDITVTSLTIKGTASPEGPYNNNVRLAKGRTEALAEYVRKLYSFPKGFIKESYEPVDWTGLADWLRNNEIDNRYQILAIVNGDLAPENRNSKIKSTYPKQYNWLLENVYPSLRHSDYNIKFTIRTYTEVDEILAIMKTAPQKLSLAELFVAARAQEEGSPLYTEAFEIAVRMYPESPEANLNAGIAAMKRGELDRAQIYLNKAGNSDEAKYARAVLTALNGDPEDALYEFMSLANSSVPSVATSAQQGAQSLTDILNFKGNFTTLQ